MINPWGVFAVLIATYNLKNLFLAGEGPAKPNGELRPLVRMLDQLDADIVLLQEVGSLASLTLLNGRLARPYAYPGLVPGNSDRSIHLAVLSRHRVRLVSHHHCMLFDAQGSKLQDHETEAAARAGQLSPLRFCRDLLRVDVLGLELPLSIFAVHLKSRTNRDWRTLAADEIRAAECRRIGELMAEFRACHPHALMILCGDFNDRLSSDALAPLQRLAMQDPLGDLLQRNGRNPSTYWPKRRMRIDHILVCQHAAARVLADSARIHASRMAQTASDHYPVSLELQICET